MNRSSTRRFQLALLLTLVPCSAWAEPPAANGGSSSAAPTSAPEPEPATDGDATSTDTPQPTAATPAATTTPAEAAAPASDPKVAALRGELTSLMDDLVAARARAAVLGKALFKTRVVLRLQNLAGPDPVLAKVVLTLDGTPVFRGDSATLGGDEARKVFEGFAAPGPHLLAVEIEQRARDNAAYGYTLRDSYKFEATREKETELTLVLDDDSNLASDFPDDGEGEYDVRTHLRVKSKALGAK